MIHIPVPAPKRPPFQLPDGLVAQRGCKDCYGRGQTGYDTVRRAWLRCGCVKRKERGDETCNTGVSN